MTPQTVDVRYIDTGKLEALLVRLFPGHQCRAEVGCLPSFRQPASLPSLPCEKVFKGPRRLFSLPPSFFQLKLMLIDKNGTLNYLGAPTIKPRELSLSIEVIAPLI